MSPDEVLQNIYLFSAMGEPQLARIRQAMRRLSLSDGEHLFEWGEQAKRFYFVSSGQMLLKRISPDGDEKVIEIVRPGQTFAEAVMFMESRTYPVTAVAHGKTALLGFDNQTFIDLLRDSPDTCFRLMADMAMRLRKWVNEVESLTLKNATARTISYLLYQLPEGATSPATASLSTPKHVIASRLSIKPETFSRILHDLSEEGLISVDGASVHIHNIKELSRHSQF